MRHVSSWGIRMELLRIAMRTPCHQGEGSLHLAHVDGPLAMCGIIHSTRMYHIRNSAAAAIPSRCITSGNILPPPLHPVDAITFRRRPLSTWMYHIWNSAAADIPPRMFHIRNSDAGWERRAFQLSRAHISGSAYSAYPESFAAIFCIVPRCFS